MNIPKLAFVFCFLFATQQATAQFNFIDKIYGEIALSEQQQFLQKEQLFTAAPTGNYDLKYHRIQWNVSPDTLFISGSITSYFLIIEDAEYIYFDLHDSLTVDSVTMAGSPVAFEHVANAVKIFFPAMRIAGTLDSVAVYYHGRPAYNDFGSMQISEHETGPNLWTLSEPYGASDWWPCKQALGDKIDSLDIFITTPEGYRAGTAGSLISENTEDGYTTCHWKTKYPTSTYLIGISVANFETYSFYAPHHDDSVLFYNLIFPESFEAGVSGVDDIVESFELYLDIYGDYPFKDEKYGHMQFGWGGGMEHQTMSSVVNFYFDLLVHEMAHQWFGDKVTCATWDDIWLNEGFATYSNALCYYFIDDIHIYWPQWLKGTREVVTSEPGGSVWVNDTSDVSRVFSGRLTYYKGAWLLHMLHWTLGEEEFFTGVQSYINDPALAFDHASTSDLISHLENAADTTLTEFFEDWFYGEGYPMYQLLWTQDDDGPLTIALSQTPSHPSVDFFEMPVPVRLKGENDSTDVILHHISQGQIFVLDPGFAINEILLDPDMWLLHKDDAIAETDLNEGLALVVVYPNPVDDFLIIQHLSASDADYTINLFDAAGREVANADFSASALTAVYQLDVASLSPGMYVLHVESGSKSLVQKVVVK